MAGAGALAYGKSSGGTRGGAAGIVGRRATAVATLATGRRILVLGSPGSGKTTFAERLGRARGLPVVHLDDLHWRGDWVRRDAEEFEDRVRAATAEGRWVLDGNYASSLASRLERADTVVFLDVVPVRCLASVCARDLRRMLGDRRSLPAGVERGGRVDLRFLTMIASFRKRTVPQMSGLLRDSHLPVVELRGRAQARAVAAALEGGAW